MKFDIMSLVFMVIAITVGNVLGPMLGGYIGFGGGLIGAFISGLLVFVVYALLSGAPMKLMSAVIFAVAVYASVLVTGYVTAYFGFLTGIFATFAQAVILSLIWSFIAPKESAKAPVKV